MKISRLCISVKLEKQDFTNFHKLYRYHDDQSVDGDGLVVELLRHHQDSALWVQVEELGAVRVEAAVDGEHQLTVGVCVLSVDLQDVLPRGRVLGYPHLKQERKEKGAGFNSRIITIIKKKT